MKIISEIGINHNGDFRKIEELIRQSAIGGADYAKFQLYDSIRVFGDESRKKNEFTFDQVKTVKSICKAHNIEFFASVFDEEKIEWCKWLPFKNKNVKYFNCISKYPTSFLDLKKFSYTDKIVGLSDHSYGPAYALYNIAHGAQIIEKHFTLNKGMEGNDHIGSMDLAELKAIKEYGQQFDNITKAIR